MPMPSSSLTTTDKFLIQAISGTMFAISSFWHGHRRIRSVGISNIPLGFALFCKYARPFASTEARAKALDERKKYDKEEAMRKELSLDGSAKGGDPLDDPAFARVCLLWSVAQLLCGVSGIFDWYTDVIIKGAVVFHILMTVQDSIETRQIELHKEELQRKRAEKLELQSAQFWKFLLPKPLWRWLGYERIVMRATTPSKPSTKTSDTAKKEPASNEDLREKVHTAKKIIRGKRETAVDDLIWGAIQIAYVAFDVTHKQAMGTAFAVYLCTFFEDVLDISTLEKDGKQQHKTKKKIKWFKIMWVSLCLYYTGKLFFS
ncbi:unnamed protein product [Pseudo-nitzschia multistriata]|uniref:Uncharacterized protein n=1 Tax=Pseudo-nitzschia multistriata TaxID=183589 RepID=A0A448ZB58_9STRA|nr:unnamed protein product [Pseudo-nitzschia multistriata]